MFSSKKPRFVVEHAQTSIKKRKLKKMTTKDSP